MFTGRWRCIFLLMVFAAQCDVPKGLGPWLPTEMQPMRD